MRDLDAIKSATWNLHTQAERSGIIADILAGCASCFGVAVLLRNLLPVYELLDTTSFCAPGLARSASIAADLRLLSPGVELPLLPEGTAYADEVRRAGEGDGSGLIAHAYVRYLGDLNGGQIMKRRLAGCLGGVADELSFLDYPSLIDKVGFIRYYRNELDRALRAAEFDSVVRSAVTAFDLNIALSTAVRAASSAVAPAAELR